MGVVGAPEDVRAHLRVEDVRMKDGAGPAPAPVQVLVRQTAPVTETIRLILCVVQSES